jgi:hypothetical protein
MIGNAFLDNLTLAQVMPFAWNFETFTITTAGTATFGALVADAAAYLDLSPIATDRYDQAQTDDACMWYGDIIASTSFGSFPNIRTPRSRVCYPSPSVNGCLLNIHVYLTTSPALGEVRFWVGTDPSNAGRFRLYYQVFFIFNDPSTGTIALFFQSTSSSPGSTASGSGTYSLAGLSGFNWYAFRTTGSTAAGVSMGVTSSSFTY